MAKYRAQKKFDAKQSALNLSRVTVWVGEPDVPKLKNYAAKIRKDFLKKQLEKDK